VAFHYKLPVFNTWLRYWYWEPVGPGEAEGNWVGPYYSPAQLRGNHQIDNYPGVLLPKWSRVRPSELQLGLEMLPDPWGSDIFQLAGWGSNWAYPFVVRDVGAGFPNEYRTMSFGNPFKVSWDTGVGRVIGGVSTFLQPPDGYDPLPLDPPGVVWDDPDFM